MKLQLDKLYTIDFSNKLQFGDLPASLLVKLFSDGRFCSEPLSHTFGQYFDDLTYVNETGYDFVHPEFPYIEQKQITSNGFKFCPSNMIGQGRKCNRSVVEQHITDLNLYYLIPSILLFPLVHIRLIEGARLLDMFKQTTCSVTNPITVCNTLEIPYAA